MTPQRLCHLTVRRRHTALGIHDEQHRIRFRDRSRGLPLDLFDEVGRAY
jgi:hypothetical protein